MPWTIVSELPSDRGNRMVLARCTCGTEKRVRARHIETGASIGCRRCAETVHGHAKVNGRSSPTYTSYVKMIDRCTNPKNDAWHNYGGRGIVVCQRWLDSFENFLADMGVRPPGTSIDRIDNSGHYEPGNCRWATVAEQRHNMRTNVLTVALVNEIRGRVEHGETQASLHRRFGLSRTLIASVVHRKAWPSVP